MQIFLTNDPLVHIHSESVMINYFKKTSANQSSFASKVSIEHDVLIFNLTYVKDHVISLASENDQRGH